MMKVVLPFGNSHRGWHPVALAVLVLAVSACRDDDGAAPRHTTRVAVAPYLEQAVFDLEGAEGEAVEVVPAGVPVPRGLGDFGSGRIRWSAQRTTLVVRRPEPGWWQFTTATSALRVQVREVKSYLSGRLREPRGRVAPRAECRVIYEVEDSLGDPFEPLAETPLEVAASLSSPSEGEAAKALTLEPRPELGGAVFATAHPIPCTLSGRYWLDVLVSTRDPSGRRVVLFRDVTAGFVVTD